MKKVKIKWESGCSPLLTYESINGLQFSWVNPPKDGVFRQVTSWHSCRETFIGELVRIYNPDYLDASTYSKKINQRKLRVAVLCDHRNIAASSKMDRKLKTEKFQKTTVVDDTWMKTSLKIINVLEKSQGWGLSKIYKVDNNSLKKNYFNAYIFSGSAKWMRAPQSLSLCLLILRLGRFNKEFKDFTKIDDLESVAKIFEKNKCIGTRKRTDAKWFNSSWEHWKTIVNSHKELFLDRKLETNYRLNNNYNGIQNLIDGGGDKVIKTMWKKINKSNKTSKAKKLPT